MGVGGSFWDLLKPYARQEGLGFLRGRRVAVDLSFWIVSHSTAIRARSQHARHPHIRTTFFRTLALFSKMGAFPVFVVDGQPSPLKSQARAARFFRGSGIDVAASTSTHPEGEASVPAPAKRRNALFTRYVKDCVELLGYLGMPVLQAKGEAEALCAQLNNEGEVAACITSDSDAFLFGAKTVIKVLRSNCKEPFECYNIADIESGIGLKRKQMVAMTLLIGCDHDLQGVPGFGVETALRFVQLFDEDHILDKLHEIGRGIYPFAEGDDKTNARDLKAQRRHENWQIKVCKRLAAETNFPNEEIIKLYLCDDNLNKESGVPLFVWNEPNVEALVDMLKYTQSWEPSYIRQHMLPMLSTIYLREMASSPCKSLLLCDQYEFHSIQRIKIRYGHPYYLVKWKRATRGMLSGGVSDKKPELDGESEAEVIVLDDDDGEEEATVNCESADSLDEPELPQVLRDDNGTFLLTDEDIQLVDAAFPNEARRFQAQQRLKEEKSRSRKSKAISMLETPKGPRPSRVQLSIKEFYRSTKGAGDEAAGKKPQAEAGQSSKPGSRKASPMDLSKKIPKSLRRRLLFD
ncbi:hypothetical protein ACQ4PT_034574 [Festuca glaucescens]